MPLWNKSASKLGGVASTTSVMACQSGIPDVSGLMEGDSFPDSSLHMPETHTTPAFLDPQRPIDFEDTSRVETLATINPRMRIAMDVEPCGTITGCVTIHNRSNGEINFEFGCNNKSQYVMQPKSGYIKSGDSETVMIKLNVNTDLDWDIGGDRFLLKLGHLSSLNPKCTAYQKERELRVGLSAAAKIRLAEIIHDKKQKKWIEAESSRKKRVIWATIFVITVTLFILFLTIDLCP